MKKIIFLTMLNLFLFARYSYLNAHGIGIYGSCGVFGELGGGLIYETVSSLNRLFSDRIAIGYKKDLFRAEMVYSRFILEEKNNTFQILNTFSFGFFRSALWRMYCGPSIGFHIEHSVSHYYNFHDFFKIVFDIRNWGKEYPIHKNDTSYGIDHGFSLGINLNPGEHITINLQMNALADIQINQIEKTSIFFLPMFPYSTCMLIPRKKSGISCSLGWKIDFNLAVLYRVHDRFM